jgi:hypothetical protein
MNLLTTLLKFVYLKKLICGEVKVWKAIEVFNKYYGENPTDDIANYCIDEYLL